MGSASKEEDNRFSGAIGEDYDATFPLICPHLDQLEQSVADAFLSLRKSDPNRKLKILDLGSGDGLTAVPILNTITNIDLTALDNESKMLGHMEAKLGNTFQTSSINYVCEDALSYLQKCQEATFDCIGSCFVIHNMHEDYRRELIKEIYRVLKVNGIFANADKLAEPQPHHGQVFLKQLTLVIDAYTAANRPDLLREWVLHYLEDNIPGVVWFESDAIMDLKNAGFTSVSNTFRYDLEATLVAVKD